MTISERMFEYMTSHNVKPATVSKKIGIPPNTLTNWSQRKTDPPAKLIVPICEVLGCSLEYLLTGEETKKQPVSEISENGQEMLELFSRIPDRDQVLLIGRMREMVSPILEGEKKSHALYGDQAV